MISSRTLIPNFEIFIKINARSALGQKFKRSQSSVAQAKQESSENAKEEIMLPMRIKRSPTDILKALAATVGQDETAAHYKFMDDPYLIPSTPAQRRNFSLCKESGKKAAIYLATKFARFFEYDQDEPRIRTFRPESRPDISQPDAVLPDQSSSLIDLFSRCLENGWTRQTVQIYDRLQTENRLGDLPLHVRLDFLEFLCFHNNQEPVETEFREQNFYKTYFGLDQSLQTVWDSSGMAMEIFNSLETKTSRAYGAVICGMVKYSSYDEAYDLFLEMKERFGLKEIDLHVLESVLTCLPHVTSKVDEAWSKSLDLIKEAGLEVNTPVFNALLKNMDSWPDLNDCAEKGLMILREMNTSNLKPSLATYYFLLRFHRQSLQLGSLVEFILSRLEMAPLPDYCTPSDTLFLPYCMSLIAGKLNDKHMAYRLHKLLLAHSPASQTATCIEHQERGYKFLNDFQAESDYYESFVQLLSRLEEPAKFVEFFNNVFPHIFSPSVRLMAEIIENLEVNGAQRFIPQLYPSIVAAGYLKISGHLVKTLVNVMYNAGRNIDFNLKRQFGDVAFDIKEKVDLYIEEANRRNRESLMKWSPRIVSQLSELCQQAGQLQRSQAIAATQCHSPAQSRAQFGSQITKRKSINNESDEEIERLLQENERLTNNL